MKQYLLAASLLICLANGFTTLAQTSSRYSLTVDLSGAKTAYTEHLDSLEADILLTGIGTTPVTVVLTELNRPAPVLSYTLPMALFGQPDTFPTGSSTKAVRISLTKDGYGVGKVTNPYDPTDVSDVLQKRTWRLPVQLQIGYSGKQFTVTLYKNYAYTGSLLLDAARLDSLREASDPALYDLLGAYYTDATGRNALAGKNQADLKAYFKEKVTITLMSSRTDAAGKPLSVNESVPRNPYLFGFIDKLASTGFPDVPTAHLAPQLFIDETTAGAGRGAGGGGFGSLSNPMLAADALATFIARRFKEEINVAFLNEFRKKLQIDSTLGYVFPQTKAVMLAIDPYQYTTFLESMKTAFEADISLLPVHSAILLDTLVARRQIKFAADRVAISRVALQTLQRTLDNRNDYWGALRAIKAVDLAGSSDELTSVMLTGSLLINSILDTANQVRLPSAKATLKKDYTELVLGLLLARQDTLLQHIQTKLAKTGPPIPANYLSYALHTKTGGLDTLGNAYDVLSKAASAFGKTLLAFEGALAKIRAKKKADEAREANPAFGTMTVVLDTKVKDKTKLASYTDFALTLTEVLNQLLSTEKIFPNLPAFTIRQRVLKPVQDGIQAFRHIQEKEYALAVIYTANMLVALTSRSDSVDSRTTAALKKYGSFMTSVVAAETRDQMLDALETAALPVGSYRIKRNNFFSLAINTYGGIAMGSHIIREFTSPVGSLTAIGETKGGFLVAPYAPLGISGAWGRNADYVDRKDHGSFGFHINLIDVGALALVRLSDETATLPEFTWKNLLAPGLQLLWGLPKSVFTVGGGVQLGPELRQIDLKQNKNIIDTKQWRIGLTIAADIPVFNVFTQANRRKIETLERSSLQLEAGKPK